MEVNVYAKYQATDIDTHHTIKVSVLSSNIPSNINLNVYDETGVQLIGILPIVMGEETYGFTARVAEYNGSEMVSFADRYFYIVIKNKRLSWKTTHADIFLPTGNDANKNIASYANGLNGNEVFKKISGTFPTNITLTPNGILTGIPIEDDIDFSPFIVEVAIFVDNEQVTDALTLNIMIDDSSEELPPEWITEEGLLGNTSYTDTKDFTARVLATGANVYALASDMEKESLGIYEDEQWQLPPGLTLNSATGQISGKVTTNQIKSWPFGVIAYKIYMGTNIPSDVRRFVITSNYVVGEHQIHWVDEDVINLGSATIGKTISLPIPLATVDDGSTIKYTLVGSNVPKNLKLSPEGLLSGRIEEQLSDTEDEKTFTFMIQATTSWTYVVKSAKITLKKGLGKNAVKLSLRINNEYRDEYNNIKAQLNTNARYKTNDETYSVDVFPRIDVATLKCFDRELLASMLNFGNPELVQFLDTRYKTYSQVDLDGNSIGSYEVYYKAIDEQTYQWDEIDYGSYDFQSRLDSLKVNEETGAGYENPDAFEADAKLDFNNKSYNTQIQQLVWDDELGRMVEKTFTTTPVVSYDVFNFDNVRKLLQSKIYVKKIRGYCYYDIGNQEKLEEIELNNRHWAKTEGNYYYIFDKEDARNSFITLNDNIPSDKDLVLPRITDLDTDDNNEYIQFLDVTVEPLPEWKRIPALSWHPNTTYLAGQTLSYDNVYYEVKQQFTTTDRFEFDPNTLRVMSSDEVIEKLPSSYIPTLDLGYYNPSKNRVYLNNLNDAEKIRYEFWYKKAFLFWDIVCEPVFNDEITVFGIPFVPMYNRLEDYPEMFADHDLTFEVKCINRDDATIVCECVGEGLVERISPTKIIVKPGSTVRYSVSLEGYFSQEDEYPLVNDETIAVKLEKSVAVSVRPTPEEATVTLYAKGFDTVSGEGEQTIIVSAGTEVTYKVELENYMTLTGSIISNDDITKAVLMKHLYTLKIVLPDEQTLEYPANVEFIAGNYEPNEDGRSITVPERTIVLYKISSLGMRTITNSIKLTRDTTLTIYFENGKYTLSVQSIPSDALITFTADEPIPGTTTPNSISVQENTRVGYLVEKEGYASQSYVYDGGISSNITVDVTLKKYVSLTFNINPDDANILLNINTSKNWVKDTKYELHALVNYNGKYYNCTTPHTSGSAFDASKWNEVYNLVWVVEGSGVSYQVTRFGYTGFGSYKIISQDTIITKEMTDLEYLAPEWREHPELGWEEWDAFVKENNTSQYLQKE